MNENYTIQGVDIQTMSMANSRIDMRSEEANGHVKSASDLRETRIGHITTLVSLTEVVKSDMEHDIMPLPFPQMKTPAQE